MKRIQVAPQGLFRKTMTNFLLADSSTPFFIEIIFLVTEGLLYTSSVSCLLVNTPMPWVIFTGTWLITALIGALFIRFLFDITIARLIYIPCAVSALSLGPGAAQAWVVWVLLLLNVGIDVLSRIQFEFATQNPFSQTINHTKFLHYGVFLLTIIFKLKFSSLLGDNLKWTAQLVNLILFVLLLIIKIQSSVRNQVTKELMIRLYLLSIGYYTRNLIINWCNSIDVTHQNVLVIFVSQLVYSLAKHKYGKIQVDTEISNGNIISLVFSIMSYSFSCTYDSNFEDTINELLLDKNATSFSHALPPNLWIPSYKKGSIIDSTQQASVAIKKISTKMEQLLKDSIQQKSASHFKSLFLLVQIKFNTFANVVISKKMLSKLQQQCSCLSWIDRLCLYKFEQKLHRQIQSNYEINELCHFENFLQNQKLRTIIIKHSYDYLSLWRYMNNPNFLFKKLTKLFVKVIQRKNQINRLFNSVVVKCNTVILLFIDYLYMVRRDVPSAIKICRGFQIYEEAHYSLKMEDKIYMCVSLEHINMLIIQNVSYNIKKILGYEKSTARHANVGLFLPSFFAQAHQKLVTKVVYEGNGNYYVMKKHVLVKHFDGYYLPAIMDFKMVYNSEGCLMMEGFLQVVQDNSHNWPNYFFVKHDEGELIQIGPPLKNLIELNPRKFVHINEYFESKSEQNSQTQFKNQKQLNIHLSKKYLYSNGIQYEYDLMRNITSNQVNHSYYVCKNNLFDMPSQLNVGGIPQKFEEYLSQFLKFQKYPVRYEDFQTNLEQYFNEKNKAIIKFQQKTPCILFVIILAIFLGIFTIQGILIQRVSVTKQTNNEIKQDMDNLIQFYHSLQNMGAIVNSFSLTVNNQRFFVYNYYQIPQLCLTLQKMNEKLIKFDLNKYGEQGGTIDNSPKPLRQLVSDYIANFYMNLYVSDLNILTMSRLAVHTYSKYIFGDGLDDYLIVFRDRIIQFRNQDQRIKLSLSVCICIMIVVVYVLMYKIDAYERQYEYESLNLISNINAKPIFINSISEFIRRVAGGVNETQVIQKQAKFKKSNNTTLMSQGNSRIQMSSNVSARQNSVRGFFQEQVLSSTNRDHRKLRQVNATMALNTLEMKERIQQDESERKQLKIRPRSKRFILGWTLLVGTIIGVAVIGMISDQSVNKIELPKSMLGLTTILNKQILFSSMINSYIQNLVSKDRQDLFDMNYKKYTQLETMQIVFEETSSPQFSNFTDMLQKTTYSYICEYNDCNATYKDFINIIYFSAVHKLNQFMVDNPNVKFDAQGSYSVSALFYSNYLLESIIYKLLKSYLSDYSSFQYKKLTIYFALYFSQISALIICLFVSLSLYIWHFKNQRNKCYAILDLIKKQSYMIKQMNDDR